MNPLDIARRMLAERTHSATPPAQGTAPRKPSIDELRRMIAPKPHPPVHIDDPRELITSAMEQFEAQASDVRFDADDTAKLAKLWHEVELSLQADLAGAELARESLVGALENWLSVALSMAETKRSEIHADW